MSEARIDPAHLQRRAFIYVRQSTQSRHSPRSRQPVAQALLRASLDRPRGTPRPGRLRAFPPEVVVHVRALACEPPADRDQPLSRWSIRDLGRATRSAGGIGAAVSDTTVWRWLHQDAIRPWQHRCWIFPCDPDFAPKAGRVLDLYHRT